mgnify:CR=1 FL=1|tara:strand:+ start:624 stop:1184 length:561 start_codon:yes stop_codon:yes gene_type:complete
MTSSSKRRWHLIRESIKFQIKLTLDAVRDLLLSPVAIICTVLDLVKGNSTHQGHFQRLMQWGHNTDHWLNLFGNSAENINPKTSVHLDDSKDKSKVSSQDDVDIGRVAESLKVERTRVDSNLDKLFSKIEGLLEEQQQTGGLTATAKQKIAYYLALLNANRQDVPVKKSSTIQDPKATSKEPKNRK